MIHEAIIWQKQKQKQKDGHKGYGSEWSLHFVIICLVWKIWKCLLSMGILNWQSWMYWRKYSQMSALYVADSILEKNPESRFKSGIQKFWILDWYVVKINIWYCISRSRWSWVCICSRLYVYNTKRQKLCTEFDDYLTDTYVTIESKYPTILWDFNLICIYVCFKLLK